MSELDKVLTGVGSIASPVAAVGGSIVNGIFQSRENRKNREWTEKQNELAWQRQNQLINEQRAYDSPKEQMKRLMDAGLNPNLIYGDLGGNMQAQSAPNAAGSYQGVAPQVDPLALSQSLLNMANARKANKETQLSDAKTKEILGDTPFAKANIAKINAETNRLVQDYNILFPDEEAKNIIKQELDTFYEHIDENGDKSYIADSYIEFKNKVINNYFKKLNVEEKDLDYVLQTFLSRVGLVSAQYHNLDLNNKDLEAFLSIAEDYYSALNDEQGAIAAMAVDDNDFVSKFGGREAFRALYGFTSDLLGFLGEIGLKRVPKKLAKPRAGRSK